LSHQAGSGRNPSFCHNQTQERLHRIGTDIHALRDLFAGQSLYEKSHRLTFPLGEVEADLDFLNLGGWYGRPFQNIDHGSRFSLPAEIEDVPAAATKPPPRAELRRSKFSRFGLFVEKTSGFLYQYRSYPFRTCSRGRVDKHFHSLTVVVDLIGGWSDHYQPMR
jgi:hypothetical protein